jgi:exopolyphosphatase/guanosine-5'-triphosphate,3'-diphosphate pyrophosphatase
MAKQGAPPPEAQVAAVVDIGSNSVRMIVAQIFADGRVEELEEVHRPVRFGHDTFVIGRLRRQTMNAAIAVLRDCRKILDSYQVGKVLAVATSAVREASNSDVFLDRVATATDLRVEVIEPSEESRLTISAVRAAVGRAFGLDRKRSLIVEVGGGSALLTVTDSGRIAASGSYPLGAVRLQEILSTFGERPDHAVSLLRSQIASTVKVIKRSLPLRKIDAYLVVGWDARFLAAHIGRPARKDGLSTVTMKGLDKFIAECAGRTTEKISIGYGLPFAHAETLIPALLVNRALAGAAGVDRMIVTGISMRDGLLLDLANQLTGKVDGTLAESVLQSARTIAEKYQCDEAHAADVAGIAVRLFDELRAEHRLGPRQRLLLQTAALLHEVGGFVGSRAHHKHSYYLIKNSEIFGLRQGERDMVALLARYHRRAMPRSSHPEYMALPRRDRRVVTRLAAVLRVADALARGQAEHTAKFKLTRSEDELTLTVPGVSELSLEQRSLSKKGDLFEDVFGMQVSLETG